MRLRTYKVIPLNSEAGLLEFVEKTKSLGDLLIPAHKEWVFLLAILLFTFKVDIFLGCLQILS